MASRPFLVLGVTLALVPPCGALGEQELFRDDFSKPVLDRWVMTSKNDFRERVVERSEDERLRLRADTMGTRDDSVKYVGVRLRDIHDVSSGLCVGVSLDWNDQANGSYLTAAVVLAEEVTETNPWESSDWISIEYVGVPPGRNARMQLRESARGRVRILEDEGWPESQRSGRKVDEVRLQIELLPDSLSLWENGELKHRRAGEARLTLTRALLYLQLVSHSNYGAREVYFDGVVIGQGSCSMPPVR